MVLELRDFIKTYDNAIAENVCDFLIETFESNEHKQERVEENKTPNFTQYNLTENRSDSEDLNSVHNYLISKVFDYRDLYYEHVDKRCFPEEHNFEEFRIKKYMNDGNDMFDTHVDVTDHSSAVRYLSFMWYLNDVNEGGETVFCDAIIKPQKGTLLVFPPLWVFPHKGMPPISNEKYLLSTYLHYQ